MNAAQQSALLVSIRKGRSHGSAFIVDAPGIGKTSTMEATIIALNELAIHRHVENLKPMLVVVPYSLVPMMVETLHDEMGVGYTVWRWGDHVQKPSGTKIDIKPGSIAFGPAYGNRVQNNLVVMSYDNLSRMKDDEAARLRSRFQRILCGAAHTFGVAILTHG